MTADAQSSIIFGGQFARELPELAVHWQAEEAPDPRLLVLNEPLAEILGFNSESLQSPEGLQLLLGTVLPSGTTPVAQGYAGHQFGSYSPRLGDGRALLLGELMDSAGNLRDIHLKGSGRTPFARGGDGLAAIGPMLREYVVSEAMHAMGIPSTRSLAVVATGRPVRREALLPGAVLTRVSSSHLRVGSFQYVRAMNNEDLLRRLADHAIERHYPQVMEAENPYLALFEAVLTAQATLTAHWMLVGFIHGVMNTDNMTISGETIDYGPCAFIEVFDPATVYSSIDESGRYAYGNQPIVAQWNLARLAEALLPLFHENQEHSVALAQESLGAFHTQYSATWLAGMKTKLGLDERFEDEIATSLTDELFALLQADRIDYTSFFRNLGTAARGDTEPAHSMFSDPAAFDTWVERWRALEPDANRMDRTNPVYIPRNHLVEEALAAAVDGDLEPFSQLLAAVTAPFEQRPGFERYAAAAPESFGPYRTFCGT
ncbi:YdiU family protein [Glutamicibacter sp. MNS18]|uniref:protein adenylyltransferase SelO n=1 Tax=Glutamicibacter sp. MNS18 TaxID=2989817 RepID=UPI0022366A09|nr:YdiU family protein [Glutamicibacter sp. MNS18]MCW4464214.1 YdiU family protein [Glutamicibacter sp. MNS18]